MVSFFSSSGLDNLYQIFTHIVNRIAKFWMKLKFGIGEKDRKAPHPKFQPASNTVLGNPPKIFLML